MGSRINKGKIFRKVHELEKGIEAFNFKLASLKSIDNNYHYGYTCGITKFLYKLEGKTYDRYNTSNRFDAWVEDKTDEQNKPLLDDINAGKLDSNGNPIRQINIWTVRGQMRAKICDMIKPYNKMLKELQKSRGKLLSQWHASRGRKNKSLMGDSLSSKVLEGDMDNVKDYYYCSKSGREVTVNFKMSKKEKTANRYYPTYDSQTPETFFDIGMLKIKGFMFDSHFQKLEHGSQNTSYANPTTKRGVLFAAAKAGARTDVVDAARKLRNQMSDTIFCHYVGSRAVSSFKIRDVYILKAPKKVNKQMLRGKFRGKERSYKQRKYKELQQQIKTKEQVRLTNENKCV